MGMLTPRSIHAVTPDVRAGDRPSPVAEAGEISRAAEIRRDAPRGAGSTAGPKAGDRACSSRPESATHEGGMALGMKFRHEVAKPRTNLPSRVSCASHRKK